MNYCYCLHIKQRKYREEYSHCVPHFLMILYLDNSETLYETVYFITKLYYFLVQANYLPKQFILEYKLL